jgi:hypothetical protein
MNDAEFSDAEEDSMELDLIQRLRNATKEQLVLLIQELTQRHPMLHTEIEHTLTVASTQQNSPQSPDDEEFSADTLVLRRPLPPQNSLPLDLNLYQQRLLAYSMRLQQGDLPQDIFDDLIAILQDAEMRADQYDYQQALNIYALVIDTRLTVQHIVLAHIFDRSIDEFMPVLAMLLSEVSSLITSEDVYNSPDANDAHNTEHPSNISKVITNDLSPLLPTDNRQCWLERLFSLWIKRIDNHQVEENLPEIMLEVAWSEDVSLLQSLIEKELYQQPTSIHSNIVDFSLQSRTRMLEKFLRELPHG